MIPQTEWQKIKVVRNLIYKVIAQTKKLIPNLKKEKRVKKKYSKNLSVNFL